jgi:putative transposase
LRQAVKRYEVPVYGFNITSNHVHLIVHVDDTERVGLMMHLAAGAFAQQLNRRKGHEGSVWEHPYHCTIVQDGQHLLNCLRYVSLNMVRAGVVEHPSEWRWCAYDELMGELSRYRIVDIERLLQSLDMARVEDLRRVYQEGIHRQLERRTLARAPEWTESLAVGDRVFVERVARDYQRRGEYSYDQLDAGGSEDAWSLRESPAAYDAFSGSKSAPKTAQCSGAECN